MTALQREPASGPVSEPASGTAAEGPSSACPGCGLVVAPATGPTHPYIGASAGCWALFTELLVLGPGTPAPGQLVTDAYAIQHPGMPERRAIQSVCVHLISICAHLERGWPADRATSLLRSALAHPTWWRWLDPTPPLGTVTVADVLAEAEPVRRGERVVGWAEDLWLTYQPHHDLVRGWLDELTGR